MKDHTGSSVVDGSTLTRRDVLIGGAAMVASIGYLSRLLPCNQQLRAFPLRITLSKENIT